MEFASATRPGRLPALRLVLLSDWLRVGGSDVEGPGVELYL